MTDAAKWIELAERCEKATGPDRELDFEIGFATGWREDFIDGNEMILDWDCNAFPNHYGSLLPSVTEEFDVISTRIRLHLDVEWLRIDAWAEKPVTCSFLLRPVPSSSIGGGGATITLALCAAFCRAMAAKEARNA
jgi:hypothetical protein